jgi:hypothetical protein
MKRPGGSRPSARVLPANQRLNTTDQPCFAINLRLVMEHQFVSFNRMAQAHFELEIVI